MSIRSAATAVAVGPAPGARGWRNPPPAPAAAHPLDLGDRGSRRHQARVHPRFDPVLAATRDAEQLDAVAELGGRRDVRGPDPPDPLDVNGAELHRTAEGECRQDRQLVRGIGPVHVGGRVGLGVAERLGFGQHHREIAPGFAHLGQDVVAGAVQDAADPLQPVRRQPLAQRLDHRDAAGHRRLERQRHPGPLGGVGQLRAVYGDQRLVRRHHRTALRQSRLDQRPRSALGAADQLHHHVDIRVRGEADRVLVPAQPGQVDAARAQLAADRVDVDAAAVRSPIAGRIGDRTVRVGQYVQVGTRLMTVVPVDRLYLTANFKETQIGLMRVGQPASIKVDALPGEQIHGVVESFSPGTGSRFAQAPINNATGNFTKIVQRVPVRIRVDAGPEARRVLIPGLSVSVSVDTRGAKRDADARKDEDDRLRKERERQRARELNLDRQRRLPGAGQ